MKISHFLLLFCAFGVINNLVNSADITIADDHYEEFVSGGYTPGVLTRWLIPLSDYSTALIKFTAVSLGVGENITVLDDSLLPVAGAYEGTWDDVAVLVHSPSAQIEFMAVGGEGAGFGFTVDKFEPLMESHGVLVHPPAGGTYPPLDSKQWAIYRTAGFSAVVQIVLSYTNIAQYDMLTITRGFQDELVFQSSWYPYGYNATSISTTRQGLMMVRFQSDDLIEGDGFTLHYFIADDSVSIQEFSVLSLIGAPVSTRVYHLQGPIYASGMQIEVGILSADSSDTVQLFANATFPLTPPINATENPHTVTVKGHECWLVLTSSNALTAPTAKIIVKTVTFGDYALIGYKQLLDESLAFEMTFRGTMRLQGPASASYTTSLSPALTILAYSSTFKHSSELDFTDSGAVFAQNGSTNGYAESLTLTSVDSTVLLNGSFTISMWVKDYSPPNPYIIYARPIWAFVDCATQYYFAALPYRNAWKVVLNNADGYFEFVPSSAETSSIRDGGWHYVSVSLDATGNKMSLLQDGERIMFNYLTTSVSLPFQLTINSQNFGCELATIPTVPDGPLNLLVRDLSFWNRVMSSDEFRNSYANSLSFGLNAGIYIDSGYYDETLTADSYPTGGSFFVLVEEDRNKSVAEDYNVVTAVHFTASAPGTIGLCSASMDSTSELGVTVTLSRCVNITAGAGPNTVIFPTDVSTAYTRLVGKSFVLINYNSVLGVITSSSPPETATVFSHPETVGVNTVVPNFMPSSTLPMFSIDAIRMNGCGLDQMYAENLSPPVCVPCPTSSTIPNCVGHHCSYLDNGAVVTTCSKCAFGLFPSPDGLNCIAFSSTNNNLPIAFPNDYRPSDYWGTYWNSSQVISTVFPIQLSHTSTPCVADPSVCHGAPYIGSGFTSTEQYYLGQYQVVLVPSAIPSVHSFVELLSLGSPKVRLEVVDAATSPHAVLSVFTDGVEDPNYVHSVTVDLWPFQPATNPLDIRLILLPEGLTLAVNSTVLHTVTPDDLPLPVGGPLQIAVGLSVPAPLLEEGFSDAALTVFAVDYRTATEKYLYFGPCDMYAVSTYNTFDALNTMFTAASASSCEQFTLYLPSGVTYSGDCLSVVFSFVDNLVMTELSITTLGGSDRTSLACNSGANETLIAVNAPLTFTLNNLILSGAGYSAIYVAFAGVTLNVHNTKFQYNTDTPEYGGAIFLYSTTTSPSTLLVEGCYFGGNSAIGGGAVAVYDQATVTIRDTTFMTNSVTSIGGAILAFTSPDTIQTGTVTLESCDFYANNAPNGGAVVTLDGWSLAIHDCTVRYNSATETLGGGIAVSFSSNLLVDSTLFVGNSAEGYGGAIYIEQLVDFSLLNCTFEQNTAVNASGAVFATAVTTGTISSCEFLSNTVPNIGGFGGALSFMADTLAGNTYFGTLSVSVESCTFADNFAQSGMAMCVSGDGALVGVVQSNFTNHGPSPYGSTDEAGLFVTNNAELGLISSNVSHCQPSAAYVSSSAILKLNASRIFNNGGEVGTDIALNLQGGHMSLSDGTDISFNVGYPYNCLVADLVIPTVTEVDSTTTICANTQGVPYAELSLVCSFSTDASISFVPTQPCPACDPSCDGACDGYGPYACTLCEAGVSYLTTDGQCLPCALTMENCLTTACADGLGSTCELCAPGHVPESGNVACYPCPPGTTDVTGAGAECTPCVLGTANPNLGWTGECSVCAEGTYADYVGAMTCTSCPPGYTTLPSPTPDATLHDSATACVPSCLVGEYRDEGGLCQACTPIPRCTGSVSCANATITGAVCSLCAPGCSGPLCDGGEAFCAEPLADPAVSTVAFGFDPTLAPPSSCAIPLEMDLRDPMGTPTSDHPLLSFTLFQYTSAELLPSTNFSSYIPISVFLERFNATDSTVVLSSSSEDWLQATGEPYYYFLNVTVYGMPVFSPTVDPNVPDSVVFSLPPFTMAPGPLAVPNTSVYPVNIDMGSVNNTEVVLHKAGEVTSILAVLRDDCGLMLPCADSESVSSVVGVVKNCTDGAGLPVTPALIVVTSFVPGVFSEIFGENMPCGHLFELTSTTVGQCNLSLFVDNVSILENAIPILVSPGNFSASNTALSGMVTDVSMSIVRANEPIVFVVALFDSYMNPFGIPNATLVLQTLNGGLNYSSVTITALSAGEWEVRLVYSSIGVSNLNFALQLNETESIAPAVLTSPIELNVCATAPTPATSTYTWSMLSPIAAGTSLLGSVILHDANNLPYIAEDLSLTLTFQGESGPAYDQGVTITASAAPLFEPSLTTVVGGGDITHQFEILPTVAGSYSGSVVATFDNLTEIVLWNLPAITITHSPNLDYLSSMINGVTSPPLLIHNQNVSVDISLFDEFGNSVVNATFFPLINVNITLLNGTVLPFEWSISGPKYVVVFPLSVALTPNDTITIDIRCAGTPLTNSPLVYAPPPTPVEDLVLSLDLSTVTGIPLDNTPVLANNVTITATLLSVDAIPVDNVGNYTLILTHTVSNAAGFVILFESLPMALSVPNSAVFEVSFAASLAGTHTLSVLVDPVGFISAAGLTFTLIPTFSCPATISFVPPILDRTLVAGEVGMTDVAIHDCLGNYVSSLLLLKDPALTALFTPTLAMEGPSQEQQLVTVSDSTNSSATFSLAYVITLTGQFQATLSVNSTLLSGTLTVLPAAVNVSLSTLTPSIANGSNISPAEGVSVQIAAVDSFLNTVTNPTAFTAECDVSGPGGTTVTATNAGFDLTYGTVVGVYTAVCTLNGAELPSSPLVYKLLPGSFRGTYSTIEGEGLTLAVAGRTATFTITPRDQYGNLVEGISAANFTLTIITNTGLLVASKWLLSPLTTDFVAGSLLTVSYTVSGKAELASLTLADVALGPIRTYEVTVVPSLPASSFSYIDSKETVVVTAGQSAAIPIYLFDEFENAIISPNASEWGFVYGPGDLSTSLLLSSFELSINNTAHPPVLLLNATATGDFSFFVNVTDATGSVMFTVGNGSFCLTVLPALPSIHTAKQTSLPPTRVATADPLLLTISLEDSFGNNITVISLETLSLFSFFVRYDYNGLENKDIPLEFDPVQQSFTADLMLKQSGNVTLETYGLDSNTFDFILLFSHTLEVVEAGVGAASFSRVDGNGLYWGNVGDKSVFSLQVYDAFGNARGSGGDAVAVELLFNGVNVNVASSLTVTDLKDGNYIITHTPTSEGEYLIAVLVNDLAVPQSPFVYTARLPGDTDPFASTLAFEGANPTLSWVASDSSSDTHILTIYPKTATGEASLAMDDVFVVHLCGEQFQSVLVQPGRHEVTLQCTVAGAHTLITSLFSVEVVSNITVVVFPSELTLSSYTVSVAEISPTPNPFEAGSTLTLTVQEKDRFGNPSWALGNSTQSLLLFLRYPNESTVSISALGPVIPGANGTTSVNITLTTIGNYSVGLESGLENHFVQDVVRIVPSVISPLKTHIVATDLSNNTVMLTAGEEGFIRILPKDVYGNTITEYSALTLISLQYSLLTEDSLITSALEGKFIFSNASNAYILSLYSTLSFSVKIALLVQQDVFATFNLKIMPATVSGQFTDVVSPLKDIAVSYCGEVLSILVQDRDQFNNIRHSASPVETTGTISLGGESVAILNGVPKVVFSRLIRGQSLLASSFSLANGSRVIYVYSEMYGTVTLTLGLIGQALPSSPLILTRSPLPAVQVVSGYPKFSNTLSSVRIRFESATNGPALFPTTSCAPVLSGYGLFPLLGANPECLWASEKDLVIKLGAGATLTTSVSFTLNSTLGLANGFTEPFESILTLSPPDTVPQPIPIISAPSEMASCGDLVLDAKLTRGLGGRLSQASFNWSVEFETSDSADLNAYLTSQSGLSSVKIIVPETYLPIQENIIFMLAVTNFVNETASVTHRVLRTTELTPLLKILTPANVEMESTSDLYMEAKALLPPCAPAGSTLSYSWTAHLIESATATLTALDLSALTTTAPRLLLPATMLESSSQYRVMVNAALRTPAGLTSAAEASVGVTTQQGELLLRILYGNAQYSTHTSIFLDASSSIDTDTILVASDVWSFAWTCSVVDGEPTQCDTFTGLFGPSSAAGNAITIPSGTFDLGAYSLTLIATASPSARTTTAQTQLEIVPGDPPLVRIFSKNKRINPAHRLRLESRVIQPEELSTRTVTERKGFESRSGDGEQSTYSYKWSAVSGSVDLSDSKVIVTSDTSQNLVLQPYSLLSGQTYEFELAVTDEEGNTGMSFLSLNVNSEPTGGVVTITPTEGYAAKTTFTLTAQDFVDPEGDYPLSYQYFALTSLPFSEEGELSKEMKIRLIKAEGVALTGEETGQDTELYLPENTTLVAGIISDSFGASSFAYTAVTVFSFAESLSASGSSLEEYVNNTLRALLEEKDESSMLQVVATVASSGKVMGKTMVEDVLQGIQEASLSSLSTLAMLELRLQALHTIASGGNELANITDTQNTLLAMIQTVIVEFLGKLGEEPLNEKASKHILRTVDCILGSIGAEANTTTADEKRNKATRAKVMGSIIALLAQVQVNGRVRGEPASTIQTDSVTLLSQRLEPSELNASSVEMRNSSFAFPEVLAALLQENNSVGVTTESGQLLIDLVFAVGANTYGYVANGSLSSPLLTLSINGASVANLSSPILLTLAREELPEENGTTTCMYWSESEGKFVGDGCEVVAADNATITCACTHLTSFGLQNWNSEIGDATDINVVNPVDDFGTLSDDITSAAVISSAAVLALIYVLLFFGIVFVGKKDKEWAKQMHVVCQYSVLTLSPHREDSFTDIAEPATRSGSLGPSSASLKTKKSSHINEKIQTEMYELRTIDNTLLQENSPDLSSRKVEQKPPATESVVLPQTPGRGSNTVSPSTSDQMLLNTGFQASAEGPERPKSSSRPQKSKSHSKSQPLSTERGSELAWGSATLLPHPESDNQSKTADFALDDVKRTAANTQLCQAILHKHKATGNWLQRFIHDLRFDHIWLSCWNRKIGSTITCRNRVFLLFLTLLFSLLASAMVYKADSTSPSLVRLIIVGVIISLVVSPLPILLSMVYRMGNPSTDVCAEQIIMVKKILEHHPDHKKEPKGPRFGVWPGRVVTVIALLLALFATYLCLLYAAKFEMSIVEAWLATFVVSVLQSAVFSDPFSIAVGVLLNMIFGQTIANIINRLKTF